MPLHDSDNPLARPLTVPDFSPPPPTQPLPTPQVLPWDPSAPTAAPPASANGAPTLGALGQALRRRWLLAVSLGLLSALAGVLAVWLLLPPKYTTTAILKLSSARAPQLFGNDAEGVEFNVWKNTQPAILKSPSVLNEALKQPGIRDLGIVRAKTDPVGWLMAVLKTDFLLGPEILRVSLSGDDAQETARLLNAVTNAYSHQMQAQENERRRRALFQLNEIYRKQEQEVQARRRELAALKDLHKLDDEVVVNDRYRDAQRQLLEIEKGFRDLGVKALTLKSEINALKKDSENLADRQIPDAVIDAYLKDDPAFTTFAKDLAGLDDEIHKVATLAKEPRRSALLKDLQQLKAAALNGLVLYRQRQRPRVEEQIRIGFQLEIQKKKGELGVTEEAQQLQREEMARWQQRVKELDPNGRPRVRGLLQEATDKLRQSEKFLENVGLERAKLEAQPEPTPRVSPLANAEPPAERDTGRQVKLSAAASLGLFGLALFGVAYVESRARKISTVRDVTHGLGLCVLGTLPALPPWARKPGPPGGAKALYWQGLLTEAVDALRTQLLHLARTDGLRVVMVSSAAGGEGKTTLASQLAASLARAWKNTLLIDGDLRNPAAHTLFDLPPEPGLSEALRGEVDLADVVKPTPQSRLWLVPAGHWDSHAVQALAQEGVRGLFDDLAKQFDFIIVDSCPVLPVADALALAQHVDAVLYAVLRDVSRGPAVLAAHERLAALGVRALGAVVLGATDNPPHLSYQSTRGAR
jgi:capsular exopolysaccharide synthesis family protein